MRIVAIAVMLLLTAVVVYSNLGRKTKDTDPSTTVQSENAPAVPVKSANLGRFQVIESDTKSGKYKQKLDLTVVWQDTGIPFKKGDTYNVHAQGTICALSVPCVDPNGQGQTPESLKSETYRKGDADEFPGQSALPQALIGKVGEGKPFQIGVGQEGMVAEQDGTLKVMPNVRLPEIKATKGEVEIIIQVHPKAGLP